MGVRVEEEVRDGVGYETKKVPQQYTVRRYFGPCLICERETPYSASDVSDEWLAKQFKRRRTLLGILRGTAPSYTSPSVGYVEMIVCADCR